MKVNTVKNSIASLNLIPNEIYMREVIIHKLDRFITAEFNTLKIAF